MQSGMAFFRSKGELQQETKFMFSMASQLQKQTKQHNHEQQQQQQKKKVRKKQKVKKIQRFIRNYIGRHQPLSYRQQYSFSQTWENSNKDINPPQSGYYHRSGKIKLVTFMLFPIFIIQLWLFSITRIFSYDNCWWIFLWGLLQQLIFICFRICLFIEQFNHKVELLPQIITFMSRQKYSYLIGCGFSLLHHSIALSGGPDFMYMKELEYLVMDLVVVGYRYSLFSEIYSVIRIEMMGTKYRLKMNLFDLSVNVFSMIHIFALLLFLCTYYDPVHNWHQSSSILVENTWMNNYLESFYFACTTMLTVGFGDISPTNSLEIICILIVQIIGIVNNAYIINQFGVTLTQIYMRRNMLERDIANAQKLVNFKHLHQQIRQKLLNSLINYQPSNGDLLITEQQSLLSKTSEQIKQQVIQSGQRRAVKMNLYLMSTFSKKLLDDLSIKLVKVIYPPHIYLPITRGKQRFYIIAKGSVDIIPDRKTSHAYPLKSINIGQHSLLNQIYGYGAVFSKKPWRLKAITRSYVVCFCCQLQDLVECVGNYEEDYQKYFQICHRMQVFRIPEEYEVTSINSKKEHYVPSIFYLLKKNKSKKFFNLRKQFRRGVRRFPKILQKFEQDQINSASYGVYQSGDSFADVTGRQKDESRRSILFERTLSPLIKQINMITKPRNQQARNIINKNCDNFRKFKIQQKKNEELNLSPFCQVFKQFKKYFPCGNITTILIHYNLKIQKKLTKQQIDILRPPIKKNRFEQLMTRLRKNSQNS